MIKRLLLVFSFVVSTMALQAETYYLQAYSHKTLSNPDYEIQVVREGANIRIQGLYHALPEAWIEGHMEDNMAVFESGQKLAEGVYMQCSTDMKNTVPLKIEYNDQNDTYEAYYQYLIFANTPDGSSGESDYEIYEQLQNITFFSGSKALTQVPEEIEIVKYRLEATDSDTDKQVSYEVTIGFDTDNIYIKGLCAKIPEAWVKGTYNPHTGIATFMRNQYLGQTEVDVHTPLGITRKAFDIWFTGIDEKERYMAAAVFSYNTENGAFQSLEHSWVVFNGEPTKLHYLQILRDVVMCPIEEGSDEDIYSLVAPPDGLETSVLKVTGTDLTFSEQGDLLQAFEVKCGVENNEIYIQGLFSDMPEAWIKGKISKTAEGSIATFPKAQYLGRWYEQMDTWMLGCSPSGNIIAPVLSINYSTNQIASLRLSNDHRVVFTDSATEVGKMPFAIYSNLALTATTNSITTTTYSLLPSPTYDLVGRRISQPHSGLYIMNGRKKIMK